MPISNARRARNRLQHTCLKVSKQVEYTQFITVGYSTRYLKTHNASSHDIVVFFNKITTYLGLMGLALLYFWVLAIGELEQKPHFHAMIQLPKGYQLTRAGLRQWWGKGDVNVDPVYDQQRLVYYLTKINDPFQPTPYSRAKLKKVYGHSRSTKLAKLLHKKQQKRPVSQFFVTSAALQAHLPDEPKAVQTYTSTERYFTVFPHLQQYLEVILPEHDQDYPSMWDQSIIKRKLQEAYPTLPRNFDDLARNKDRKLLQLSFVAQWLDYLPPVIPHTHVTDLAKVVRCQKRPGKPAWLAEGKVFHDQLEQAYQDQPTLTIDTDHFEELLKEVSLQVREQTLRDPALSLTGRLDHLLLDEEGFVVRDDKYTPRPRGWRRCYTSAIFQVHAYAFLVACRFPTVPCRALQVYVHPKGTSITQVFTFVPVWEWFLSLLAHALLWKWGLDSQVKNCPPACKGIGDCPLIDPYPHLIKYDEIGREELKQLYKNPGTLPGR